MARTLTSPILTRLARGAWLATAVLLAGLVLPARDAAAQIIQNNAVATANGAPLDTAQARVTLTRIVLTTPASTAEIAPNTVPAAATGTLFDVDIATRVLPAVPAIQNLGITVPAGFGGIAVAAVTVNGAPLAVACPTPAAGQYCATVTGSLVQVAFGAPLASDPLRITVRLALDAPAVLGNYPFTATLTNSVGTLASTAGDADGDASDANSLVVRVSSAVDSTRSTFTALPPLVVANGISSSVLTATLLDPFGTPLAGRTVAFASDRGALDTITQPAAPTDVNGVATGAIRSNTPGLATLSAILPDDSMTVASHPTVTFTSGVTIRLDKVANRARATLGEVVTYTVTLANQDSQAVAPVFVEDMLPAAFRYLSGSATRDGAPLADPAPGSPLVFALGSVPALVDGNNNGVTDPGEPGFVTLSYRVVVGSGATPGGYSNLAHARDACATCWVSNTAEARIEVVTEPVFSMGTVLGRVFEDADRDGLQGRDEGGIAGARIALDDGTVAITDRDGLYHLASVSPGHRLVKIDVGSLPGLARPTGTESQFLTVTSGMLAKANFGVAFDRDTVVLGRPGIPGLAIAGQAPLDTVDVRGNVNDASVLVNGRLVPLRAGDARLSGTGLEERVTLTDGVLVKPVEFHIHLAEPDSVSEWSLAVFDPAGHPVRRIDGRGIPPETLTWDGRTDRDSLVQGGAVYRYQLSVREASGARFSSPMRAFGVERKDPVAVTLMGDAFDAGATALSAPAREALHGIAEWLRLHPEERIVIEGHTDSIGSAATNQALALRRARAAGAYLSSAEKVAPERLEMRAFGESRPIASNSTPEGRLANRRIELHGRSTETRETRVQGYDRISPTVAVNDSLLPLDEDGRFSRRLDGAATHWISVSITDPHGRVSENHSPLPEVSVLEPGGTVRLTYGAERDGYRVRATGGPGGEGRALASANAGGGGEVVAECRLKGRTDPRNAVELDGVRLAVAEDSTFVADLALRAGSNAFGLVVRNAEGISRLVTVPVQVSNAEPDGRTVIAVDPIPNLRVALPPQGARLPGGHYPISGVTDPGVAVTVNGQALAVAPDGSFAGAVVLPTGRSAVVIQATDSLGRVARLEREAQVGTDRLFLVAIADGAVGKLEGGGLLRDAVQGGERGLYTEGRIAYYLKGVVRGRYLLTSAYDSGLDEFAPFFDRMDGTTKSRLLTNLDPDHYYPVYGDSSVTEFDSERHGRFYLAVESQELRATVGASSLDLTGGELASFQRTVDGAHVRYQSVSRTRFGDPVTQVTAIGAEARLFHVRDELRGTGGSLYYLSHQEVAEGGEQVALVVRDEKTGLVRMRVPQRRGADYTMDYPAGRLLFTRPVSSVAEAGGIISHELLAGDPLVIEVEYETRDGEDRRLAGGHARQQLGDHVAVGGTYVRDDLRSEPYELSGVEGELRLSQGSRVTGEVASSHGSGSDAHFSDDGGLSFTDQTATGARNGQAWRAALDLDAGEWIRRPGTLRLRGYIKDVDPEFVSSGNLGNRGATQTGVGAELKTKRYGELAFRFDAERRGDSTGADAHSHLLGVQWRRDAARWGLGAEMQSRGFEDGAGLTLDSSSAVAARIWTQLGPRLRARLEQQQTLRGLRDDRTTLGLQYQLSSKIGLSAQGTTGSLGNAAEGSAAVSLGAGTFYVTERLSDAPAGSHATTALGAQVPIGPSSRVYSEYQWQQTTGDDREVMLVGAEKQMKPASSLLVTLGGEHGETHAPAGSTRRSALTGSATLAMPSGTRFETRNELRLDGGVSDRIQILTSNQAEARLVGGLTVLGRWRWSETRDRRTDRVEARLEEHGFGVAMRPLRGGPTALARFTRVGDTRPTDVTGSRIPTSRMDVVSLEGTTALGGRVEWTAKGAARVVTDGPLDSLSIRTHSSLLVNRLSASIGGPFGIGVEYRVLAQHEAGDSRTGWLQELTWDPTGHVRLGAGFNFADFSDNEFSRNDSSVRGWFLRLQGRY